MGSHDQEGEASHRESPNSYSAQQRRSGSMQCVSTSRQRYFASKFGTFLLRKKITTNAPTRNGNERGHHRRTSAFGPFRALIIVNTGLRASRRKCVVELLEDAELRRAERVAIIPHLVESALLRTTHVRLNSRSLFQRAENVLKRIRCRVGGDNSLTSKPFESGVLKALSVGRQQPLR